MRHLKTAGYPTICFMVLREANVSRSTTSPIAGEALEGAVPERSVNYAGCWVCPLSSRSGHAFPIQGIAMVSPVVTPIACSWPLLNE
jgi:hypothetical protein